MWLLIGVAVALALILVALRWMVATYLPGMPLVGIFTLSSPTLQLFALAIVILSCLSAFGALTGDGAMARSAVILILVFTILGAVYGELDTHFGWIIDNEINFATMAPGRVETLKILALGLLGSLPGLMLRLRVSAAAGR